MSNLKRNHYCGTLAKADNEKEVVLCGWVAKRRDHGGLIFIDLRDRSGIVQVVVDPDHAGEDFAKAEAIRSEYVIKVHGVVRLRSEETINPNLATGEVEVVAKELEVLNSAKTPPFYIQDGIDVDENLRLKYRYLDLRRPEMQRNLMLRHKVTKLMRRRTRLPRTEPRKPRQVLCSAAVPADFQTAFNGSRYGTLLPDCTLLPR